MTGEHTKYPRLGHRAFSPYSDLLLHDGRALTLLEAVVWHGGEAAPAQARFVALGQEERAALLAFLGSL